MGKWQNVFHLGVIVCGLTLVYFSTRRGINKPLLQTPEERLDAWDKRLTALVTVDILNKSLDLQTTANNQVVKLHEITSERVARLSEDRTKAIDERSKLNSSIAIVDGRMNRAESRFLELPRFIANWVAFTALINEAGNGIEVFALLQNMYRTAAPFVAKPFSGWRLTNQTFESVPTNIIDAEKWARSLERHVQNVNAFYLMRNLPLPPMSDGHLFTLINTWIVNRNETSGDKLLELLREHYAGLCKIRGAYAASMEVAAFAKAMTS